MVCLLMVEVIRDKRVAATSSKKEVLIKTWIGKKFPSLKLTKIVFAKVSNLESYVIYRIWNFLIKLGCGWCLVIVGWLLLRHHWEHIWSLISFLSLACIFARECPRHCSRQAPQLGRPTNSSYSTLQSKCSGDKRRTQKILCRCKNK